MSIEQILVKIERTLHERDQNKRQHKISRDR